MANSFSKQLNKDFLFNIKNAGKYISNLPKCEEDKKDAFVSECSSTSERFIQPNRKTYITAVAGENFNRKNK